MSFIQPKTRKQVSVFEVVSGRRKLSFAQQAIKTTRDFEEQVVRKRPYIQREWCLQVTADPIRREAQSNGRIRFWGRIQRPGENSTAIPARGYTGGRRDDPQRVFRSQLPRGSVMKLHYYPETDSLYIELSNAPGAETREIVEGLIVDLELDVRASAEAAGWIDARAGVSCRDRS